MAAVYHTESLRIVVYPNDHRPVHCHVIHNDWEITVEVVAGRWAIGEIKRGKPSISEKKAALKIVESLRNEVGTKWREYHGS